MKDEIRLDVFYDLIDPGRIAQIPFVQVQPVPQGLNSAVGAMNRSVDFQRPTETVGHEVFRENCAYEA